MTAGDAERTRFSFPQAKLPVKEREQLVRGVEVNADQRYLGPRHRTPGADIKDGPPYPIRPHIELHAAATTTTAPARAWAQQVARQRLWRASLSRSTRASSSSALSAASSASTRALSAASSVSRRALVTCKRIGSRIVAACRG